MHFNRMKTKTNKIIKKTTAIIKTTSAMLYVANKSELDVN